MVHAFKFSGVFVFIMKAIKQSSKLETLLLLSDMLELHEKLKNVIQINEI